MKTLKTTLLTLILGSTFVSFSQNKIEGNWDGSVTYSDYYRAGQTKDFLVDFETITEGLTHTEWDNGTMSPCKFKTELLENGKLKLIEYPVEIKSSSVCYFRAELTHTIEGDMQYLNGKFDSYRANGSKCSIAGEINLSQEYNELEIELEEATKVSMLSLNNANTSVFPNPTKGEVTINFTNPTFSNATTEINIINSLGVTVLKKQIVSGSIQSKLDLSSFDNGIYLLEVVDNKKVYSQKRVILSK